MNTILRDKVLLSIHTGDPQVMYMSEDEVANGLNKINDVKVTIGKDISSRQTITTLVSGNNFVISKVFKVSHMDLYIIREIDIDIIGLRQAYDPTKSPTRNIQERILASELGTALGNCEIHQIVMIPTNEDLIDYLDGHNFIIQVGKGATSYHIIGIDEKDILKIYLVKDKQHKEVGVEILNLI